MRKRPENAGIRNGLCYQHHLSAIYAMSAPDSTRSHAILAPEQRQIGAILEYQCAFVAKSTRETGKHELK